VHRTNKKLIKRSKKGEEKELEIKKINTGNCAAHGTNGVEFGRVDIGYAKFHPEECICVFTVHNGVKLRILQSSFSLHCQVSPIMCSLGR